MGNVNLPTPVAIAGAALCLLGGYFIGTVAGPDTPARTTATVVSYDAGSDRLCLKGESIDGELCGLWRRTSNAHDPVAGDTFRYVSIKNDGAANGEKNSTVIYGDVVE